MSELVVLVGIPASGKTMVATTIFMNYTRINLDELKSRSREDEALRAASGNIVIDNTNVTRETRKKYIDFAKQRGMKIRVVFLDVPPAFACKLNSRRERKVPEQVIRDYHAKMEPPTVDEGFDEVDLMKYALVEDNHGD